MLLTFLLQRDDSLDVRRLWASLHDGTHCCTILLLQTGQPRIDVNCTFGPSKDNESRNRQPENQAQVLLKLIILLFFFRPPFPYPLNRQVRHYNWGVPVFLPLSRHWINKIFNVPKYLFYQLIDKLKDWTVCPPCLLIKVCKTISLYTKLYLRF